MEEVGHSDTNLLRIQRKREEKSSGRKTKAFVVEVITNKEGDVLYGLGDSLRLKTV